MTTKNFNSVPQRRADNHNPLWTKNMLAEKARRRPSPKELAANRAKIEQLQELARRGQVKPVVIPIKVKVWLGPFKCEKCPT